jgi:putative transposon-encoded protein
MATPKIETGLKETSMKSQDSRNTRKTKFEVFGEEMIEKEVKPSGNSGRIYLPLDWVGMHIKIIRID